MDRLLSPNECEACDGGGRPMTGATLTAQETARAAAALEAFAAAIRREAARRPYGGPAFATWRASRRAYAAECEAQAARMRRSVDTAHASA